MENTGPGAFTSARYRLSSAHFLAQRCSINWGSYPLGISLGMFSRPVVKRFTIRTPAQTVKCTQNVGAERAMS